MIRFSPDSPGHSGKVSECARQNEEREMKHDLEKVQFYDNNG